MGQLMGRYTLIARLCQNHHIAERITEHHIDNCGCIGHFRAKLQQRLNFMGTSRDCSAFYCANRRIVYMWVF